MNTLSSFHKHIFTKTVHKTDQTYVLLLTNRTTKRNLEIYTFVECDIDQTALTSKVFPLPQTGKDTCYTGKTLG